MPTLSDNHCTAYIHGLYGVLPMYWGYIRVAQFLVEFFKAPFIHGFLAENEWRDIVKGFCNGWSNLQILKSALVVTIPNLLNIHL